MTRTRRVLAWGAGALLLAVLAVGLLVWSAIKDLPDTATLSKYTPPLPSTVRAADGTVLTSFTRERRIYLGYKDIPPKLIEAYISAEDKTFFQHHGIDYAGIVGAVWTNLKSFGTDKRPVGASTITQQVAKNLLLTNEVSLTRKLKEAVLAWRLENAFTKPQILELYLNYFKDGESSAPASRLGSILLPQASMAVFASDVFQVRQMEERSA